MAIAEIIHKKWGEPYTCRQLPVVAAGGDTGKGRDTMLVTRRVDENTATYRQDGVPTRRSGWLRRRRR